MANLGEKKFRILHLLASRGSDIPPISDHK